jgi:hypothetical protein
VARIICVAVATLVNEKLLERASDNDLLLSYCNIKSKWSDAIAVKLKMYKCCLIIGMTQAFLKPLSWNESQSIGKSLKKERNWCLNHVNILSGSKVMTKKPKQHVVRYVCIANGKN